MGDYQRVSQEFKVKYRELRKERLSLIQEKAKEILNIDWDIEPFLNASENENDDTDSLPMVESNTVNSEELPTEITADTVSLPSPVEDCVVAANDNSDNPVTPDDDAVNTDDDVVNTDGDAVNTDGDAVNTDGDAVNTDGDAVNTDGDAVNTDGDAVNTDGDAVNTDGDAVNTNGDAVNTDGDAVNTDGDAVNTDGDAVNTDGDAVNTDENNGPPLVRRLSLSELAPAPSDNDLFGNVNQLEIMHRKQMEEFDKARELNKAKQEQGLKDKLRERQSKRRKQILQQIQETALSADSTK